MPSVTGCFRGGFTSWVQSCRNRCCPFGPPRVPGPLWAAPLPPLPGQFGGRGVDEKYLATNICASTLCLWWVFPFIASVHTLVYYLFVYSGLLMVQLQMALSGFKASDENVKMEPLEPKQHPPPGGWQHPLLVKMRPVSRGGGVLGIWGQLFHGGGHH